MSIEHKTGAHANIFSELGLPDAANLRLRAELMREISNFVKEKHLSQKEAAQAMGTTQPRLNEILNGDINKCTIDRLVNMLAAVGREVKISIKAA